LSSTKQMLFSYGRPDGIRITTIIKLEQPLKFSYTAWQSQYTTKQYRSQASLSFHNAVWDFHFPAQCWKPDNQFNWVHIVSNHNKLCFVLQGNKNTTLATYYSLMTIKWWSTSKLQIQSDNKTEDNLLNEVGNMVETILHINRLLGLDSFSLSLCLCPFQKSLFLFCFILWPVLQQDLKQTCCWKLGY